MEDKMKHGLYILTCSYTYLLKRANDPNSKTSIPVGKNEKVIFDGKVRKCGKKTYCFVTTFNTPVVEGWIESDWLQIIEEPE